jgi:hypothetical protein
MQAKISYLQLCAEHLDNGADWRKHVTDIIKHLSSAKTIEHNWLQFNDSLKMWAVGMKHYIIISRQEAYSRLVFLLLSFNIIKYKSRTYDQTPVHTKICVFVRHRACPLSE